MQITLRRSALLDCFAKGSHISLPNIRVQGEWISGVIRKIEREDGSGRNFIVHFGGCPDNWTFIRTILD